MRVLGLAFAVLLAVTVPIAAHANGARSNMGPANAGPAPGIVPVWDSGGSGRHPGVVGNHPTAGHVRQWNRGGVRPHWRQNWNGGWIPYGGPGCPPIGSGVPVAAHSIIPSLIGEARRAGGVTRSQANQKPQLSRDVVSGVVGHSFHLVRFPFVKGGRVSHRWADATWREEREARPVLVDPAISNVDRYAEPMGEVAGSAG